MAHVPMSPNLQPLQDTGLLIKLGCFEGITALNKFGRIADVDPNSTPEDVWHGGDVYTGFPSSITPEPVEIFSADADDTAAGAGARTLRVFGLESSTATAYTTEDVTLDGTTPVVTSKSWYRINRAYLLTAGASEANEGIITIRHETTTANVLAKLPAGNGQTVIAAWTVPAQSRLMIQTLLILLSRVNGSAGSANIKLQTRDFGTGAWLTKYDVEATNASPVPIPFYVPLEVSPMTDIRVRVDDVSDPNTSVAASFSGLILDNTQI